MPYDAMGNYIPDQVGMAGPQGQLTNQGDYVQQSTPNQNTDQSLGLSTNGFFNTQFPTQTPQTNGTGGTATGGGLNISAAPSSGISTGQFAAGTALGNLLTGGSLNLSSLLGNVGDYYGQQQAIKSAYETGLTGLNLAEQIGQRAFDTSTFKPYTVTSQLSRTGTTPAGDVVVELSPQQKALQQQLMGQAQNLFGQVGQDPAAQQAALYEQIRATQLPEEERQRLAMQESLFASGRGGLQTAQYGGSPEQFAYEKARQEAMAGASLAARQQAMAEQQQALAGAQGLLTSGYMPQLEALRAFGYGTDVSNLVGTQASRAAGQQATLGQTGLGAYMQAASNATDLQQAQLANLIQMGTGGAGGTGGLFGSALSKIGENLPQSIKDLLGI